MDPNSTAINGEHRSMLLLEAMHGVIVVLVVVCVTLLKFVSRGVISSELVSFVYGGAISYAGGRAASVRGALTRGAITPPNGNNGGNG